MAIQADLILEADATEGKPFEGSGKNHILISPPKDATWESGVAKVKILNPHALPENDWRTVYQWSPEDTIALPSTEDGAILDQIELVLGMLYRVEVKTAGVEASFWRYQQDG